MAQHRPPDRVNPAEGDDGGPPSSMVLYYFLALFLLAIFALGRVLWPFLSILVLSLLLTGIFQPVFRFLNRRFSTSFASLATCTLIVLLIFVPLFFMVTALSKEALGLYQFVKGANWGVKIKDLVQQSPIIGQLQEMLAGFGVHLAPDGFTNTLSQLTGLAGAFLYEQASAWAGNIMSFVFSFIMMILIIYFLLIDLERFIAYIIRLSPLPDEQERQLVKKFEEIAGAILVGNGICGLLQGVLGGLLFALFGLGSPVLWGGVMGVLAFLPIFGVGLVLIPTACILFLKAKIGLAMFVLIFYAIVSFTVEYLLKPKLVGDKVKMPTLLVLLSILGGLSVFGVLGIIYGPLIVTAFLTLAEIYLQSYDRYVKKPMERP
jgi:predicted PurR-regulated permease PerM